jgi:hypothetical protein
MKADIVNPAAPASQRYSRWDEYIAIHWMIQDAFAPGTSSVNFGHGGSGSYSFLSWHRYFLYQFEKQLQSHVPGVMLPYWDWTDPAPIMTDTFLGPNGTINNEVRSGYFARNAPGTPGSPTPAPTWWPIGLTGWLMPSAFGSASGPLRRRIGSLSGLPTTTDLRESLTKATYPAFQNALESGAGLTSFHQMHNRLHGWIGGPTGQMSDPSYSPFDPIFYLHHCNIDRLWTMWQMDGHADEYPSTGGRSQHHRNDIMYPWTGGAAGYGTYASISTSIPMPDFSAVGAKRNADTLDFRNAFDYTYDTLAIIGIGLDRTGSMNGLTPDPMTTGAPDVTKWEAAKRGVSSFLQDCETVQNSGITYVLAGIKTFRRLAAGNEFAQVFSSPGYGLVKNGSTFSRATFDSNVASMSTEGSTPLADALQDVQNTLVEPPFGHIPSDEQRYLAMLTDGLLTAGSPMSSIPDHSFSQTAVFAMGFGTGADVDYPTLTGMVAKGKSLTTPQVFHGENAGTIDKFYSNALAQAIGFTTVFDPMLELFAGEHAHFDFQATTADDMFLITAQGMDFDDDNWTFHLHGPGGYMVYGDGRGHQHTPMVGHDGCLPDVTATRANGRLSLVLQRNNSDDICWLGNWRLMVAYKARTFDAMVMPKIGELILPVSAGPVHGPRFSRLLIAPKARASTRNVNMKPAHSLDVRALSTNRNDNAACSVIINIFARTRLRMGLLPKTNIASVGDGLEVEIVNDALVGNAVSTRAFARLVAPAYDISGLVASVKPVKIPKEARMKGSKALQFDPARVLAVLEKENRNLAHMRDEEVQVLSHNDHHLHVHVENTEVAGVHHLGVYVEGTYCAEHSILHGDNHDHHHEMHSADASACGPECHYEGFTRLLNIALAVVKRNERAATKKKKKLMKKRR